ncbi:MAG: branched-chain amino acid ABC transporter substrate-binding protein [bacterium]
MRRELMTIAVLCSGLLFLFSTCGKKQNGGTTGGGPAGGGSAKGATIKIGLGAPLTKGNAAFGIGMKNAIEMVVADWNAKGGINGKAIEAIYEDDEGDNSVGATVANKLSLSGVGGVIGHLNSSVTIPASKIYNANKIISITPASTNPEVTDRRLPYVFRVCWRDDQQGPFAADAAQQFLKVKRVAVLDDRKTYGEGLAKAFLDRATAIGLQIVAQDHINPGELDYSAVLSKFKTKNPDAIFYGGEYGEYGLIIKQTRDLGMKNVALLAGDGGRDVQTFSRAGSNDLSRVYVTFARTSGSEVKVFEKRYVDQYKIPMNAFSPFTYVAGDILLQAIQDTGSTDAETLSAYLHSHSFETMVGKIEFDDKGDVKQASLGLEELKNGGFVPVWP